MIARLAALLIRGYQRTFSRLIPPGRCRFHPTCSEYAIRALRANGLFRGGAQAAWRLMRCGPWTPGGVDEVKVRAHG